MPPKLKVIKREYRTTHAEWSRSGRRRDIGGGDYYDTDENFPDPVAPEGDGWDFVGAAADGGELFWFWRRTTVRVPGVLRGCSDPDGLADSSLGRALSGREG